MTLKSRKSEPSFPRGERFELRRKLGAGGYGTVYEALDRRRREKVALKVLFRAEPEALLSFKREFRSLADVAHANLVSLYELFGDAERYFFTMELVEGTTFLQHVRPPLKEGHDWARDFGPTVASQQSLEHAATVASEESDLSAEAIPERPPGRLDLPRLREATAQLADGVMALHEAGKLHRDLKPSNVLVNDEGRVVVLDFGLVEELDASHHDSRIVGTPAYMSPEQVAGEAPEPASDWYSVGVMLYEALTGRVPHRGQPMHAMMRKQMEDPPAPSELDSEVPADLEALCIGLLKRDTNERLGGRDILRVLEGVDRKRSGSFTLPKLEKTSSLVGREREEKVLHEALRELRHGRPGVVHVHGPSGMGKSALLRHFLAQLEGRKKATVLRGRCYEQESVPYKALDPLVDALSRYLDRLDDRQLRAWFPPHAAELMRLFPVLTSLRVFESAALRARAQPLDPQEMRERAFLALRELLRSIAEEAPLVIWLDDLQWADEDSAAAMATLLGPPDPPPLLLLVSYREAQGQGASMIEALGGSHGAAANIELPTQALLVGALAPDDARRLVSTAIGDSPHGPSLVRSIAEESQGCPFVIERLVHHVKNHKESAEIGEISLQRALDQSLSRLPDATRRAMEVCSLAARPIPRDVLGDAADAPQLADALRLLRSARLIHGEGSEELATIEPYHDRLRQAVVAMMDRGAARATHRRIAESWQQYGAEPEILATHYAAADMQTEACEHATAAAKHADEVLAFDRAAKLYAWAMELGEPGIEATLGPLYAEALANAGHGAEAARAFETASATSSEADQLEYSRRAAEEWLRSGYIKEGLAQLSRTLDSVGMHLPSTRGRALASLAYNRARLKLRGLDFTARDEANIPPHQLQRLDTCWAVANGLGMADAVRAADFQTRHLILALDSGNRYRITRAIAAEASFCAVRGLAATEQSHQLLQRAEELARELDSPYIFGLCEMVKALVAYLEGRFAEIEAFTRAGEELLRGARGAAWERANMHLFWAEGQAHCGRLEALSARLPQLVSGARARGNRYEEAGLRAVGHVLHLARDEPATARTSLAAAMERYGQRDGHVHQFRELFAETQISLYQGHGMEALQRLEGRWPALKRLQMLRAQVARLAALLLRGRAALAAATEDEGRAPRLRELATRQAEKVSREATPFASPLADLLRAGAAAKSDSGVAIDTLRQAEGALRDQGLLLYAASARYFRGVLLRDVALVSEGEAEIGGQGVWEPARFAAMLVPGIS